MAGATDPQATAAENALAFGPYRLLSAQRLLLDGDEPVRLGSRAFDILTALVERAGEVVGKEELIARAWPETFVEESNLKIQVSALRRALGDGQRGHRYLVTVPGRGYNFVAPVSLEEPSRPTPPSIAPMQRPHNLPAAVTRMIGREEVVAALVSRLPQHRLMTVVGPGGIGKTTVALAVAERMIADYEDGVWLVDLSPLNDPRLVPSAVATVLGLEIRTENSLPGLIAALTDKRMLLLLDNCDHVIDAAASLAAAVLTGVPRVNILATSREPLGVAGEREHRLGPLGSPPTASGLTAAEAAAFPAVQLFVERVTAIVEDFALTDANARPVVEICQRLDGLPLAIEFAAPRVEVLGVESLAAGLTRCLSNEPGAHRLPLLAARRRTATPRHRTMRAVIDWSYGLLSEDEQQFFRALGIFAGGFTVEAAAAVASDAADTPYEAIDRLADLVAKSLIVADVGGAKPRFRLLDTIRAYAIEKVEASGDCERIARRHAEYCRDVFERAEGEVAARPADEWLADYAREIDNLRAALDWAFSPGGDASIGVALTAAAVALWMHLSLLEECRGRAERALAALGAEASRDVRHEMKLHSAVAASLLYSRGPASPEISVAYTRALEIAESLVDAEYRLRALWGLWGFHTASGRHHVALELAQRFHALAAERPDPNDRLSGEGMIGVSQHYLGDLPSARRHLERMLVGYVTPHQTSRIIRFHSDQRVLMSVFLARVLWLQGFPDQATRAAHSTVEAAHAANHTISMCLALAHAACPIALLTGDLAAAEHYSTMLLDHSTRQALALWRAYSRSFQGVLVIQRGDVIAGLRLLRGGFDEIGKAGGTHIFRLIVFLMAEALGHARQNAEGLAAIEEAISRSERTEEHWTMAESMRTKGELLLLQGAPGAAAAAEDHFRQALDWARRQGALSWELRAATSLARLLQNQDRPADAIACLQPVYDRFTEGFGTADLITAKQLIHELSHGPQQRPTLDS
jgi:predicted ATPase/DNA-binding winged helix-turn-helix (wHTH) protein